MMNKVLKQGLYDPKFEHEACGIGMIVSIDGDKSHDTVDRAVTILENLEHRGASGADKNTGDGAGITIQLPDSLFRREAASLGFDLPEYGDYAVAQMFVHKYEDFREVQKETFKSIVESNGLTLLGFRDVPVNPFGLGPNAVNSMPFMLQAFIKKSDDLKTHMDFERKLYVVRRLAEKQITPLGNDKGGTFYISSLSSKVIVYKGMLTSMQLRSFYLDLSDLDTKSAIALVHSRFSTNTFPSWERAHPNRYMIHNGEINTIRGNANWMKARQKSFKTDLFGDIEDVFPIIDEDGSDSSMFDNSLEFLYLTGRSLPHAMMMMIPEPWENDELMSEEKKDFYKFNNFLMEPWEGPAAIAFTDGDIVGATLDRTGLRPSRYYVTKDNFVILSSEVGVLDIPESNIKEKSRLQPGKMLVIDTVEKRIISDEEVKLDVATSNPYNEWNKEHIVTLEDFETSNDERPKPLVDLVYLQKAFGYSHEDIHKLILPMAETGKEAIGAMGVDSPLAVLSEKPKLLYDYFKQLFAQVTNPPIDGLREKNVISSKVSLGSIGNILDPHSGSKSSMILDHPILSNGQLKTIKEFDNEHFKTATISLLYKKDNNPDALELAIKKMYKQIDKALKKGANLFLLSDRGLSEETLAIPALLAASGVHHYLIRKEVRTDVGLVVETAEAREVHHFVTLFGYGVTAINPYLAFETLKDLARKDYTSMRYTLAKKNYIKASVAGMVKVMTKMGISTLRSYHGSQIFEAIGIRQSVIDDYFKGTVTRIDGIGLKEIERESILRHNSAFGEFNPYKEKLEIGGEYQYKKGGENHLYNPETIYLLQQATKNNDYATYKKFSTKINTDNFTTLRHLLDFNIDASTTIPIEEVESVDSIVKRFKSGAMSYGSISKEAHETIAIAMNRLGAKSNSGEGGEDKQRFESLDNGDSRSSAIKQVASGRFGVTSNYLVNSEEIQIKIAQGAKPGEGGHLPGKKVFPKIAEVRHSTPGVGLISPPPHHDIYSIEDLAQLIYDLKMANDQARINVKLVSEVGVGTVAAGVAKGKADVILVSGYDGGTGASPQTSIKNAGLPWELGLAEVHQTLLLNGLRDRVVVETDGKLLTGRDVVVAALLGAEEYGFATVPLVTMGCIMMRVCNQNTCPVGIATQDENLRKNFTGKPEYIVNYMRFIAEEMREIMALLGIRTINELVGRTDKLKAKQIIKHWKASLVDLSNVLYTPYVSPDTKRVSTISQEHNIDESLDKKMLLNLCKDAIENGTKVSTRLKVTNLDRVVGTHLGSYITRNFGEEGLPEDTVSLNFVGSAGQSFGAFVPSGITLNLYGDANDYVGKGLSGGKIIVTKDKEATFDASSNIIIGNTTFYGATSGEAYINGQAGERFCVRNSGVKAVVEGVGDHGCEYMTGGAVVILGPTGSNFAAGMSGGVAYILDFNELKLNKDIVIIDEFDEDDKATLKSMIEKHVAATSSEIGQEILQNFDTYLSRFTKVIPTDYKKMTTLIKQGLSNGLNKKDALNYAFNTFMKGE